MFFLFFSNRICKEAIDDLDVRMKYNAEVKAQAAEEGLQSPSDSGAADDIQLTIKERICTQ